MNSPNFLFFDPESFVERLNSMLHDVEETLSLDDFHNKTLLKSGFSRKMDDSLRGKQCCFDGAYSLMQPHEFPYFHPFNARGKIGSVSIKRWYLLSRDYDESFENENLKLRIHKPLLLRNGKIEPCCVEIGFGFNYRGDLHQTRSDSNYTLLGRFAKRPCELSYLLPTDWFLKRGIISEEKLVLEEH